MNLTTRTVLLLSTFAISPLLAAATSCSSFCSIGREVCCGPRELAAKSPEAVRRYPLRGVITAVHADRSSIMVKHEAVLGVMRAMTMLFRVDEATLKSVKKGQAITALMSRQNDEWWLHDVKVVGTAE